MALVDIKGLVSRLQLQARDKCAVCNFRQPRTESALKSDCKPINDDGLGQLVSQIIAINLQAMKLILLNRLQSKPTELDHTVVAHYSRFLEPD